MIDFFAKYLSNWLIPMLMVGLLGYGHLRKVKVYETFTEGAKEGFQVAIRIIPYLVAIMVAVGMFRASGAMDLIGSALAPVIAPLGVTPEALTMMLVRPLSGSGAFGVLSETITAKGPDSYTSQLVSTLQGSTETTFYVLAVYFGSVNVRDSRHALAAALSADAAGYIGAVFICRLLFGGA